MPRYANASILSAAGISTVTIDLIPSKELQILADAVRLSGLDTLQTMIMSVIPKKLRKGTSLATAMKTFGINREVNAKGDKLLSYHPNRPKYPFVYLSGSNGRTRWKQTVEQAKRRFK